MTSVHNHSITTSAVYFQPPNVEAIRRARKALRQMKQERDAALTKAAIVGRDNVNLEKTCARWLADNEALRAALSDAANEAQRAIASRDEVRASLAEATVVCTHCGEAPKIEHTPKCQRSNRCPRTFTTSSGLLLRCVHDSGAGHVDIGCVYEPYRE